MSFYHREMFHNTDWDEIARSPDVLSKTTADWIMCHDPEQYVYDDYGSCASHIISAAPFENTNMPPGYRYKSWTAYGGIGQT